MKDIKDADLNRLLLYPESLMPFESHYHRFVYISDVSVLNERVWGFLRVKHMLYLFLAIIFLWRGYSAGSVQLLVMGLVLALLAVLSGLFSKGSMSFEAKLLALIVSAFSTIGTSKERTEEKEKQKKEKERRRSS